MTSGARCDVLELGGEPSSPLVADVHRRRRRLRAGEEPPLRLEVVLHRPVQVEVILAQVREDERVEADAVEPSQRGAVRRRLDRRAPVTRIEHLPEEPLQVDRLGRRERRRARARRRRPSRSCPRAPAAVRRARGRSGAGTPSSSFRSSPSRPRPRAPSSARRRTRPPRPPSTPATSGTRSCGTSTSSSARRRARPRRARSPPTRGRGRRPARPDAEEDAPAETARVSYARSAISAGRAPATSLGASARIRASSSTWGEASDRGGLSASRASSRASGARPAAPPGAAG